MIISQRLLKIPWQHLKKAVDNGYGIELDVQITKDMVPVVFHDNDLKRACGVNKKISEIEYKDLAKYRLFKSKKKYPLCGKHLTVLMARFPL